MRGSRGSVGVLAKREAVSSSTPARADPLRAREMLGTVHVGFRGS